MTDLRTQLADALLKAGLDLLLQPYTEIGSMAGDFADVLLSLPRVAIVELPVADADGRFWFRETCYVYTDPEDGLIITQRGTTHGDADEARETAAALLAAANAAEREAK